MKARRRASSKTRCLVCLKTETQKILSSGRDTRGERGATGNFLKERGGERGREEGGGEREEEAGKEKGASGSSQVEGSSTPVSSYMYML